MSFRQMTLAGCAKWQADGQITQRWYLSQELAAAMSPNKTYKKSAFQSLNIGHLVFLDKNILKFRMK